jgi:hypothetical protein
MSLVSWAALIAGIWALVNGVLHDYFVLRSEHGRIYNRDLLRLLMDGHILITCGAIQVLASPKLQSHEPWAYYISGIATVSLLVYCAMIWPFLKSVATITINTALLIILTYTFFQA